MPRQFEHYADIEAFQCAVEHGSFSAASVKLGSSPSSISRSVDRLERRLGAQLLRRSTRSLNLTDAGAHYLTQSRAAFALLTEAARAISVGPSPLSDQISGSVRLSVPTTWGHFRAAAVFAKFAALYPSVTIELSINNSVVDLTSDGFDLAIRMGDLPASGLVARPLQHAALCLVASPSYIERFGSPSSLAELALHRCIPFIMPGTGRALAWPLSENGAAVSFQAPKSLIVSGDVLGCVSLAEQGAGITQSYDFIVADRLKNGRLHEVLPALRGRSRVFSLIYPPHPHLPRATRALIDFLVEDST